MTFQRPDDWDAPAGATWVCGACGRNGKKRDEIGDESCFLNAVLCHDDSPVAVSVNGWRAYEARAKEGE